MTRIAQACMLVLALAAFATAQTSISGTVKCQKLDQFQKMDAGDNGGHAFALGQGKCVWTKPVTIAGVQTKDDVITDSIEISAMGAESHGLVVTTMSNGDQVYVRTHGKIQGKGLAQKSEPESTTGTWSYEGGTGKLKGIKGGGTYTAKPDSDGSFVLEIQGHYSLSKKQT